MLKKNKILFGLFSLASLDFCLLGLQVIYKDDSKGVSLTIFGFFLLVLVVQLAVLALVTKLKDNEKLKSAVAGVMLGGNIIAFYVSFFDKFQTFHKFQLLLSGLILAAVSALVLYFVRRSPQLLKILLFALVLNSLYTFFSIATYNPDRGTAAASQTLSAYQGIKFKTKPNIHLIAFDSLSPAAVVKNHMGIKDLAYVDYLQQNSTILKNLFSTGSPSKNSFNSQLRLADGKLSGDGYFAGRSDGPVTTVLHTNGYKLQTGFSDDYFGDKGQYVDEYDQLRSGNSVNDSTLCDLATHKEKILKLYGFCIINSHLAKPATQTDSLNWRQKVVDIINQKAESGHPWMTIDYMYNPIGHTPVTYEGTDLATRKKYIAVYDRKSQNDVVPILKNIVSAIQKNDPNSIVMFYGDHGPILSRGLPVDQNPTFNVQDRFAVFGAILKTNNPCSNVSNIGYYDKTYSTLERTLAGVFRCLAKDPSQVDKAVNFQEPYDFGKYLYDN